MSKFQRGQDLVHLIEVKQMGASAGYELWRSLKTNCQFAPEWKDRPSANRR